MYSIRVPLPIRRNGSRRVSTPDPEPTRTTRRGPSRSVTRSIGATRPPIRTPSRYRAPTATPGADRRDSRHRVPDLGVGEIAHESERLGDRQHGLDPFMHVVMGASGLGSCFGDGHRPSLIDGGLELTVVGSFSRIGYAVRRRLDHWSDPGPDALAGSRSSFTDRRRDGRAGPKDRRAGRSRLARRADETAAHRGPRQAHRRTQRRPLPHRARGHGVAPSVADAVDRVATTEGRLDVLIDNAGAIFPDRRETGDGIEATFATMVVGPFALVSGLLHLLRRTRGRESSP